MPKIIKRPIKPEYDLNSYDHGVVLLLLYLTEVIEAIAESQGIEFEDPD